MLDVKKCLDSEMLRKFDDFLMVTDLEELGTGIRIGHFTEITNCSTDGYKLCSFSDNPLHCDCKVWWLVVWLMHHPSLSQEEKASVVCATPFHLENAPLVMSQIQIQYSPCQT